MNIHKSNGSLICDRCHGSIVSGDNYILDELAHKIWHRVCPKLPVIMKAGCTHTGEMGK